jgi:mannose/fructose/N-acetylgalactosamine-specific phosphotransferase system component IIB
MKNIILARIDDRLIHGQVMTAWIQYTQATEVVIVDDKVAKDEFMKMIMKSSMPAKIRLTILNTEGAIKYFLGENKNSSDKYFVLVKTPNVILDLLNAEVEVKKLCIGGMGARADRTPFYRNISASDSERACLNEINKRGVEVFAQVLTDNVPVPISNI